jgi:hypothetical protein
MTGPRILSIDIETSPNLAHVWDIWRGPVRPQQVIEQWDVMCFCAKWVEERGDTMRFSEFFDGYDTMLSAMWKLLDEADMILTYNGKRFDIKRMRTVLALSGRPPFAPPRHIDLDETIKRVFDFPSHSMDFASKAFGLNGKMHQGGYQLWRRCVIDQDPKAWEQMLDYCANDVELLEKFYLRVRPWVERHPSVAVFAPNDGVKRCTKCGSSDLIKDGMAYTQVSIYQRYRCRGCGNRALRDTARLNKGGAGIVESAP